MNNIVKKGVKILLLVVLSIGLFLGAFLIILTVLEYRPKEVEVLDVKGSSGDEADTSREIKIVSWNIGYGGLGEESDFFMDGGTKVVSQTESEVYENLDAIGKKLEELAPDITILQEVDSASRRSYGINQTEYMEKFLKNVNSSYAINYKSAFVPYPFPPIGKVEAGVFSASRFRTEGAERIQLPVPFSWPVRLFNLKRCLLLSRYPVAGSDKSLVVINLHLEAYDSGEGKVAQTKALIDVMKSEYAKGNYVIAGGDFNQTFSNTDASKYSVKGMEGLWMPGRLDVEEFGENFTALTDASIPTCRSLDRAYDKNDANFLHYVIDGFVVSDNIEIKSLRTIGLDFKNSDHNPLEMIFVLKQ